MYGNPETQPGGRALKFYASVRLDIRRRDAIKDAMGVVIGNRVKVKFDEATGLPSSEFYTQRGAGGSHQIEEQLSDYREVDGIRIPFKVTILQGGQPFGQGVVEQVKLNSGLTAEELSKKP